MATKGLPILLALLCLTTTTKAQTTPKVLTLVDAVQTALHNRLELRAYDQRALMTEKELKANQLRYIPQISAGADLRYNAILATSIVPIGALNPGNPTDEVAAVRFGTNWANGAGLSLNQVIYDPTIKGTRELAELNGALTATQKAQRAEAIAIAVAQAYYGLLISESEVAFAQSDSILAATKIAELRQRLLEGRALPTDLEAARLDSAQARLRMHDIRRNAADWRAQLHYQMGLPADANGLTTLADALPELLAAQRAKAETASDKPVPSYATQLQALKMEQTAQLRTNETAGYKPSIFLNGYLGANHFSDNFDPWKGDKWFPTSYIGVSLTLPLTEGFIRQQRIQRLDANLQADQMDRQATERQTLLEFERAGIALAGAQEALTMQEQVLDLAAKRLAVTEARLSEQRALTIEVTQAQNQLQSARFQYLQRAYNLLMADLEMRRLCGLLKF